MSSAIWPAPHVGGPIDATISLPGSKSLTNRALVLAALASGPSTIRRPLVSRDTELMAGALESLGATIDRDADSWRVAPLTPVNGSVTIDCGLAGTVMRFVPPVALLTEATVTFDGDGRARERPMATTITALRALGAQVDDDGRGTLPFVVGGGAATTRGGALTIDASTSSQFVSALLLAAPRFAEGLELEHVGGPLPSQPHVDMTVTELRRRGVVVDVEDRRWRVHPGPIDGVDVDIEPDLSNAGAFVAAALVTGGRVRVEHWPTTTDQAGDHWRDLVLAFGGSVRRDGDDLVVEGPSRLRGVGLDLGDVGELTPVVAAVAALADEPSTITGVAHLRGHETDRLAALAAEIGGLGGRVTELRGRGRGEAPPPPPARGGAYHDHRMAHAASVLGLAVAGVEVEDVATTAKTYPDFVDDWMRMLR